MCQYSHAPHKDDSVNKGPIIWQWSHNILILYKYHCVTIACSCAVVSLEPRTGYEITCFLLNLFIPSPLCALQPVPETGPWPLTLVVSFEPSTITSWTGQCRAAATKVHVLGYYRFKIWKYRECNNYVRQFRSEQEFLVYPEILVNKQFMLYILQFGLLTLWRLMTTIVVVPHR